MKFQPTSFRVWDSDPDRRSEDSWKVDRRSESTGQKDKTLFHMPDGESIEDALQRVELYAQDCSDYYEGYELYVRFYDGDEDHLRAALHRLPISHWQSEEEWKEENEE